MLAVLALLLPASAHDPGPCAQVRAARGYAVAAGLDTATLDTLQARLCGAAPAPAAAPVCREARVLQRLGALGGLEEAPAARLDRLAQVACAGAAPASAGRLGWGNGVTARAADGAWRWPNGVTARTADGALRYPNAVTARSAEGRWSYPNAVTARSARGAWSRPDAVSVGSTEALLLWSCERVGEACGPALEGLRDLDGDAHIAAVLQLAWSAR